MSKILIIIPTYNEAANIGILLGKIFSLSLDISVFVVDDNSPDGTSRIVVGLRDRYPNLHLITRPQKLGLGSAYIEGFNYALKEGYDIIIQMDGDLSHQPEYIPNLVSLLEKYDLAIGSRYIKDGGISQWPLRRVLLSRLANSFTKILLSLPTNDLTSGFRAMRKGWLENIDFSKINSKGYAFLIEMVLCAFLHNLKVAECPIIFGGRRNEKSKMSFAVIAEAFFKVLFLGLNRICQRQSPKQN